MSQKCLIIPTSVYNVTVCPGALCLVMQTCFDFLSQRSSTTAVFSVDASLMMFAFFFFPPIDL